MPRTSRDGKPLKRWLEYQRDQDIPASELSVALGVSESWYSRHKDDEDFPTYEQLGFVAAHYDLDPIALRLEFGALSEDELRTYLESNPLVVATRKEAQTRTRGKKLSEREPSKKKPGF